MTSQDHVTSSSTGADDADGAERARSGRWGRRAAAAVGAVALAVLARRLLARRRSGSRGETVAGLVSHRGRSPYLLLAVVALAVLVGLVRRRL